MTLEDGLDPGTTYPRHSHGDWELLLVTQGSMRVVTGNKEAQGAVGSIFIRPPRVPHQEWCTSSVPLKVSILFFKFPPQCGLRPPAEAFDVDGRIHNLLRWLVRYQGVLPHRHRVMDGVVEGVLMDCSAPHRHPGSNPFDKLIQHVSRHLAEVYSVDSMAKIAAMSRSRFAFAFSSHMGLSPMAYSPDPPGRSLPAHPGNRRPPARDRPSNRFPRRVRALPRLSPRPGSFTQQPAQAIIPGGCGRKRVSPAPGLL